MLTSSCVPWISLLLPYSVASLLPKTSPSLELPISSLLPDPFPLLTNMLEHTLSLKKGKKNLFSTLLLMPQLASSLLSVLKEEPSSGPPTRSFPPCNLASALVTPPRLNRPKGHQWLPHGQIQWCLLFCAPQPLLRSNSVDSAFLFHKYLFGS